MDRSGNSDIMFYVEGVMGFMSFAGRVLFASVFLLAAYQEFSEFGVDGGPAAKALKPKFDLLMKHVSSHFGCSAPHVQMRHIVAGLIFLKGLGGLLFIFSSSFGAYLLILFLAFTTPVIYDFYNYDIEKPEFMQLFSKFIQVISSILCALVGSIVGHYLILTDSFQNLALLGALLFFLGMKNSIPKRQKKKVTKAKVN
ncbi:hypothetical protein ZIOFF_054077 [Zingiber officinale]|uniref:Uncharacterized protein n=1 Tax=Zingiber officinale TaxID=94328 RepID=A0A8J5FE00_ZINOF|nr:hypothetical protein ZIOFF_054077 [Zingiber officinale]